ncbi:uncharacterized protein [Apostichopus japonicus]|uniref:uncharacterized protein isoform X2 n=1 Tax=Stichopus japonicus TaxID=307972 RepID=UPI003AB1F9EA
MADLYDDFATSYDKDNVKLNYRGPHEMSSVLAEFSNSKDVSVLDVGSGTCLLGEAMILTWWFVVEASRQLISVLSLLKNGPGL